MGCSTILDMAPPNPSRLSVTNSAYPTISPVNERFPVYYHSKGNNGHEVLLVESAKSAESQKVHGLLKRPHKAKRRSRTVSKHNHPTAPICAFKFPVRTNVELNQGSHTDHKRNHQSGRCALALSTREFKAIQLAAPGSIRSATQRRLAEYPSSIAASS